MIQWGFVEGAVVHVKHLTQSRHVKFRDDVINQGLQRHGLSNYPLGYKVCLIRLLLLDIYFAINR